MHYGFYNKLFYKLRQNLKYGSNIKESKNYSINLNQSLESEIIDLANDEILGWCVLKEQKYIVCYSRQHSLITKYPMPMWFDVEDKVLDDDDENGDILYFLYAPYNGQAKSNGYKYKTKRSRDEGLDILKKAKKTALEKGQFYI